jgi:hypothetical protein
MSAKTCELCARGSIKSDEGILAFCSDEDCGLGGSLATVSEMDRIQTGLRLLKQRERGPRIVCLCGSTRFSEAFQKASLGETLAGKIVLSIGCNMKSDTAIFGNMTQAEQADIKAKLDELHKRKIDLADEVLILNVGNYIGESTRSELEYARAHGKTVRFLCGWIEADGSMPDNGRGAGG